MKVAQLCQQVITPEDPVVSFSSPEDPSRAGTPYAVKTARSGGGASESYERFSGF